MILILAQTVAGAQPPTTPPAPVDPTQAEALNASFSEGVDIFHGHIGVFLVAFMATLIMTPLCRRFAVQYGIIDRPDEVRKNHKFPIAYLGGLAVFIGILAAIAFSYLAALRPDLGLIIFHHSSKFPGEVFKVPIAIVVGMTVITLVGLFDDVANITPWQKVGGQLFAAAMLAYSDIGVKLATQVLQPIGQLLFHNPELKFEPFGIPIDLIYWAGTALIALAVLGACNASNLIDGLDGLLSGTTAIVGLGLLIIALQLAAADDGPLDHTRLVLCLALIGACMGFLPHNFNPATIFLGDAGSLLLGYISVVIILTLGDQGQTHYILAGLVIYSVPIIDTVLAIIRRKMAGRSISEGDDQHLHHMLKRSLGVKGATLTLYGIGLFFATLGVLMTFERARVSYAVVVVMASFIGVMATKTARRKQFEEQARKLVAQEAKAAAGAPPAAPLSLTGAPKPPKTSAR